jgi:hypothetical protein
LPGSEFYDAKKLREPFPPSQIGKLPKTAKRPELDYVGHAHVTDRLNEAAPGWTFEVIQRFEAGGDCWVLGRMTIDGVSRDDYGDGSDPKSAIGNAIRRCAMRWGVALDLWIKDELKKSDTGTEDSRATSTDTAPSVAAAAVVPVSDPTSEGRSGGSGTPSASAYGEGAEPDPLSDPIGALINAYGTNAKALIRARKVWPDVVSIADLTPEQTKTLLEEAP